MFAHPHDLSLIKHNDGVGIFDRANALGHDNLGRVGRFLIQRFAQLFIGLVVQCGKTVVENKDFRIFAQRTRNR